MPASSPSHHSSSPPFLHSTSSTSTPTPPSTPTPMPTSTPPSSGTPHGSDGSSGNNNGSGSGTGNRGSGGKMDLCCNYKGQADSLGISLIATLLGIDLSGDAGLIGEFLYFDLLPRLFVVPAGMLTIAPQASCAVSSAKGASQATGLSSFLLLIHSIHTYSSYSAPAQFYNAAVFLMSSDYKWARIAQCNLTVIFSRGPQYVSTTSCWFLLFPFSSDPSRGFHGAHTLSFHFTTFRPFD